MVLPNGTIMNINYEKHPELVVAMRGSGDQFGMYYLVVLPNHCFQY
jgi:hypothetical protein